MQCTLRNIALLFHRGVVNCQEINSLTICEVFFESALWPLGTSYPKTSSKSFIFCQFRQFWGRGIMKSDGVR